MSSSFVRQESGLHGSSGTSVVRPLATAISNGQFIFMVLERGNAATETIAGVTSDGAGATWTRMVDFDNTATGGNERFSAWYGIIRAATTTVTANFNISSTASTSMALYVCAGLDPLAVPQAVGQYQNTAPNTTDGVSSGLLTPAGQPGLLVGFAQCLFAQTFTASAPFVDRGAITNGNSAKWEDKALTSTTAIATTFTATTNSSPTGTIAFYVQDAGIVPSSNRIFFFG